MATKSQLYEQIRQGVEDSSLDKTIAVTAQIQAVHANSALQRSKKNARDLEITVEALQYKLNDTQKKYENLLSKPMAEIASVNKNFAETYNKQQEMIADWIVSQKAFKELAIEFGLEKGLPLEDILAAGYQKQKPVLLNQNNPEHKTNAHDIPLVDKLTPKLIQNKTAKNK